MGKVRRIIILVLFIFSINQLRGYTYELKRIFDGASGIEVIAEKEDIKEELNINDEEYKDKLIKMQDELSDLEISKINMIFNNKDKIPENVLEMMFGNIETIDFVGNYINKEEFLNIDITKDESVALDRDIPLYLQWDTRWGYREYGSSMIALSGCAPTSLSMVVSGLRKDIQATPDVIADISTKKGYITSGNFSSWELMAKGASEFGISSREIPLDEDFMKNEISKGNPLILSMRPGQFTTVGHMIVLTGVNEDGEFIINDANSIERSNKSWKFEELSEDIRNIWSYSLD